MTVIILIIKTAPRVAIKMKCANKNDVNLYTSL